MLHRTLILTTLIALGALGSSDAKAQSSNARQRFADLVSRNEALARGLNPAAVVNFDRRLTRYVNRFGTTPPRATSRLTNQQIGFRQNFIFRRFSPGAFVGGVFFTTDATPSVPGGRFVNAFQFFPAFRFFG